MDLKPLQPGAPRLTHDTPAREVTDLIRHWRVGQILEASVIGRGERGSLLLNIQGVTLEASRPPELPFRVGDRLPVQILARSPLALRLLAAPADPAPVRQALLETVPRQQPQTPLFANLTWLRRHGTTAELPAPIRPLLDSLWQSLASRESLRQPAALLAALQATGPFLENRLAAGLRNEPVRIGDDLRGQLLRLAAALRRHLPAETAPPPRPTGEDYPRPPAPAATGTAPPARPANPWAAVAGEAPPAPTGQVVRPAPAAQPHAPPTLPALPRPEAAVEELLRQVEGAIARQHNHALHSLQHTLAEGRPQWAMELPIRNSEAVDLFDLRIGEEPPAGRGDGTPARRWSVRLAFDLEGLGPVHAVISLQEERIATRFWVERPQTARLFAAWLDHLASRYRQAGLDVGALECRCGPPPGDDEAPAPLLEEEA